MTRTLLITNAAHDMPTDYLATWSQKVEVLARTHTDVVIHALNGPDATRTSLEQALTEKNPRLVTLNGHGSEACVTGYQQEVIADTDNAHAFKGRIVHALSCKSGKTLGPVCVEKGASAYIGYKENFRLMSRNKTTTTDQASDDIAIWFLDPAFVVVEALITGETAGRAYEMSQDAYRANLEELLSRPPGSFDTIIASHLYHNFKHQVLHGDGSSVFE